MLSETLKRNWLSDLMAGLTVAIVALPLALAFGVASGLEEIEPGMGAKAGLYGAIACGMFAALFGGTPGQVSGPTGPMTVVAAELIAFHVIDVDKPERIGLVFAAIILGGLIQMMMGWFKSGQLIHYIPYPVLSGFMSGIGLIIILIQINPLFGIPSLPSVGEAVEAMPAIPANMSLPALGIGLLTLALIYTLPRITRKIPATLGALAIASIVTLVMDLDIPKIPPIPAGFPVPQLPAFAIHDLHIVLTGAITLALLGALDSLLTSVVVDKTTGTRHNSDKELIGQGIGNMVSGVIGGLPGAGATMRSMVNVKAGGKTNLSGFFHGFVLLTLVLGLGWLVTYIPLAALAGILVTVGISIIDYRGIRSIRKAPKADVAVMLIVLGLTVFVDLIMAVGVGIALASFLFAKKLSDRQISEFGMLHNLEDLSKWAHEMPEELGRSIYVYTFNGPLFFGEAKNFTEAMTRLKDVKYVILRFYRVPIVDQTGLYALEDTILSLRNRGIQVFSVGLGGGLRDELERLGTSRYVFDHAFENLEDALISIGDHDAKQPAVLTERY